MLSLIVSSATRQRNRVSILAGIGMLITLGHLENHPEARIIVGGAGTTGRVIIGATGRNVKTVEDSLVVGINLDQVTATLSGIGKIKSNEDTTSMRRSDK